jgi:hypothetical protein
MSEEEIPGERNVITPEEFIDMEHDERAKSKKSGGMFGFFGKKAPMHAPDIRPSPGPRSSEDSLIELGMKVERISSRLEMGEDARKRTEEKLSEVSEKIGELRSSLIDRDKTFNETMAKFDRVSQVTEGLEPEKIRRDLSKKEQEIEQARTMTESNSEKINVLMGKIKAVSDQLDQFKGLKDVVSIAEELDKKIKIVENLKNDTERIAGKTEARLYEVNDTLSNLKSSINKVNATDETIKELLRTVDTLTIKVEKLADKEAMTTNEKDFNEKLAELKFDTESRLAKLLDAIKNIEAGNGGGLSHSSDKLTNSLMNDMSRYKKENDSIAARLEDMSSEVKLLKNATSSKAAGGFKDMLELAGPNVESSLLSGIKRMLDEEDEKYNGRFADVELRLLELSKSVDGRIDRKFAKDPAVSANAPVINMRDAGPQAGGRFASPTGPKQSKPVEVFREPSSTDINSLVKDVYYYLDAGKSEEARSAFIKLLSSYERQESSNPFILAKITELHKRIKQMK